MKKILLLQLIIISQIGRIYAQDISKSVYDFRIGYQFTWQPDSTNLTKKSENMTLLVNNTSSLFESTNKYLSDSVQMARYKKDGGNIQNANMAEVMAISLNYKVLVDTKIKKQYPAKISVQEGIGFETYEYTDIPTINWTIADDTTSINGVACQKATCSFVGRNWIAWFAPSITISDGPDKFTGLPGLIMKLNDTQNYFTWEMNYFVQQKTVVEETAGVKITPTKRADFLQGKKRFNENPQLLFSNPRIKQLSVTPTAGGNTKNQNVTNNLIDRR